MCTYFRVCTKCTEDQKINGSMIKIITCVDLINLFACIGLVLDFLLCFCKKIGKIFHEEVVLKKYHDLYKLFKQ